jgi:hypothetical protein
MIHFLPFLHLCACLVIAFGNLNSGWDYLFYIDFPASILPFGLSWYYHHPLIWFAIFGTLWWYFLSRVVEYVFNKLRVRNVPREKTSPSA